MTVRARGMVMMLLLRCKPRILLLTAATIRCTDYLPAMGSNDSAQGTLAQIVQHLPRIAHLCGRFEARGHVSGCSMRCRCVLCSCSAGLVMHVASLCRFETAGKMHRLIRAGKLAGLWMRPELSRQADTADVLSRAGAAQDACLCIFCDTGRATRRDLAWGFPTGEDGGHGR